ncbi:conserved hypothetical protein [Aster yellows witches'-broom phytoplasma AYWB]|uniref:Uncharacterized protein n=1 Tax=Aster yellows witches'-broom phytoplasma (strain AYWB) TaxID=322098 RepID=Q2NJ76_AYWBP|nr:MULTISPECIES: hypothetical protein [16SrI (Aster yellows group)]ABC65517.1 conserved hypothetical protein [Aster yellows witches'-broom phytoplasma AYWB]
MQRKLHYCCHQSFRAFHAYMILLTTTPAEALNNIKNPLIAEYIDDTENDF